MEDGDGAGIIALDVIVIGTSVVTVMEVSTIMEGLANDLAFNMHAC